MTMPLPRVIKPELVEIGDTVRVTLRKRNGITFIHEGTVASRVDRGSARLMLTRERAILFAWGGDRQPPIKVELLARPPVAQVPLFPEEFSEAMEAVRERIA